jgi:hypothetical protein
MSSVGKILNTFITVSDARAYRHEWETIFRTDPLSWAHELQRAATAANVPFEQKARALVLGSRCLTRSSMGADDQEVVHAYLVHLTDCDCTLPKSIAGEMRERSAQELVPGIAEQLALLHRMFKHAISRPARFPITTSETPLRRRLEAHGGEDSHHRGSRHDLIIATTWRSCLDIAGHMAKTEFGV